MTADVSAILTQGSVTSAVFLIPCVVILVLWIWFRPALQRKNLSQIFFELFTILAAVVVLAGALMPRYFRYLEDQTPFLIVVSLSALLHAVSSVATFIGDVRSGIPKDDDPKVR